MNQTDFNISTIPGKFILPKRNIYIISNPDAAKHVLLDNFDNYNQKPSIPYDQLRLISGNNIFTAEGENWAKKRSFLRQGFHKDALTEMLSNIIKGTQSFMYRTKQLLLNGSEIDFVPILHETTQDIMCRSFF